MTKAKDEAGVVDEGQRRRRRSGSLFGPIVLIAIGLALLFNNLGWLPDLNWNAALQLWPLLLVFLGINIIVRQIPPPFGTLLSALVGLAAVLTLIFVLFFGDTIPALRPQAESELQRESIRLPLDGIQEADAQISTGAAGAELYALEDSRNLIEGEVSHRGELHFEHEISEGVAAVRLDADDSGGFFWLNPANWGQVDSAERWQLGFQPEVPITLDLDLGSGAVDMRLEELALAGIAINGASGSASLSLPPGDYDVEYEVGSGSVRMTLPSSGVHEVEIDGGSGALRLLIPDDIPVRIEAEDGSGSFDVDGRFEQIAGEEGDEGIWQTDDYDAEAQDRISIALDAGSGSIQVGTQ